MKATRKPISVDIRHALLSDFRDKPHEFRLSNYFNHHKHKSIAIHSWNCELWLPEKTCKKTHHKKCILEGKMRKRRTFMHLTHRLKGAFEMRHLLHHWLCILEFLYANFLSTCVRCTHLLKSSGPTAGRFSFWARTFHQSLAWRASLCRNFHGSVNCCWTSYYYFNLLN